MTVNLGDALENRIPEDGLISLDDVIAIHTVQAPCSGVKREGRRIEVIIGTADLALGEVGRIIVEPSVSTSLGILVSILVLNHIALLIIDIRSGLTVNGVLDGLTEHVLLDIDLGSGLGTLRELKRCAFVILVAGISLAKGNRLVTPEGSEVIGSSLDTGEVEVREEDDGTELVGEEAVDIVNLLLSGLEFLDSLFVLGEFLLQIVDLLLEIIGGLLNLSLGVRDLLLDTLYSLVKLILGSILGEVLDSLLNLGDPGLEIIDVTLDEVVSGLVSSFEGGHTRLQS